jgi:cytochrome c-type biogenesis protein
MTSTTLRPVLIGLASVIAIALLVLLIMTPTDSLVTPTSNGIGLLIPVTFLAGLFSFLSPCTLPILPAYFAFTFQAKRDRVTIMSIAFFLGLATTIVVLGASATALSRFLFGYLSLLTSLGGVLIIVFGVMSFFGIGFSGMQLLERPVGGIVGSYLYGATFAQGALLAFVYALGLGTPLIIISTYFSRLGNGSKFWQVIKGKAYFVTIGGRELMLHTTSMASGILLVLMGLLLASGNLATIGEWSRQSVLSDYSLQFESWLQSLITGR